MKILRIALWTLLLVVAVLAGALAYLPVYLQDHQAILETAATRALGRQVEIGGLALTWSLHPYPALAVALQGLRVRNPDWARGPDLLSAAQVDVQFDLRAFLQRTIVVERLVVHGADLQLETGADGQENWHFSGGGSDAGILRLSSLRALDSTVAFQSALVPTPQGAWQAAVTRLDLGGLDGGQTLLDAELVYAETPVSLKADAGQTDASASARWPFQIQAQVAGADLQVHGSAAAPFDPADLDAAVDLQGPTPAPLGRLLRIDGLLDGPFQFTFELTRRNQDLQLSGLAGSVDSSALPTPVRVTGGDAALSGDGSRLRLQVSGQSLAMLSPLLRVELPAQPFTAAARLEGRPRRSDLLDLKATSGDSDIAGQLRIEFGLQPRVDALLTAQQLDLSAFVDPSGRMADGDAINRPAAKAKASTSIAGLDPRWKAKAAQTLPLEWLRRFDSELHLSAGHVHFGDFGVDDARLDTTLDAGHLVVTARAGQERLSATLDVRPEQTRWRIDLRHKGKLDLSWLIEAENEHPLSTVPISVDLHLNSVGDSVQGLLDSADGQLELVLGAGQLARSASRLPLGGVLFTLLDVLNPLDLRKQAASLQCAVFDFDIADGIGTSKRGLAVQTTGLNLLGGGAVNLRTSEIELHFKTAKRKGVGLNLLGIADKFVYITGTLQHPRAAFDPKDLLLYGGAAWASGGLSLVYDQIIQRLSGLGNPCDQVMRHAGRQ